MSIRKLNDVITIDFATHNPATGQSSDADETPHIKIFEDINDTPILLLSANKRTNQTGNYRCEITASVANGFEIGKSYNTIACVTAGAVVAKSNIYSFTLDGKRINDLNDINSGSVLSSSYGDFISNISNSISTNLDTQVSSRLSSSFSNEILNISGNIDVPISSRVSSSLTDNSISTASANLLTTLHGLGDWSLTGSINTSSIASAVWNESIYGHNISASFGDRISSIYGLLQSNFRITNQTYDTSNHLLTATVGIFSSSVDCESNTKFIYQYAMSASYDINGNLNSYKVQEL